MYRSIVSPSKGSRSYVCDSRKPRFTYPLNLLDEVLACDFGGAMLPEARHMLIRLIERISQKVDVRILQRLECLDVSCQCWRIVL